MTPRLAYMISVTLITRKSRYTQWRIFYVNQAPDSMCNVPVYLYNVMDFTHCIYRIYLQTSEYMCKCQNLTKRARFMRPKLGPPGSCRPQIGPMLTPWTLLSGKRLYCRAAFSIISYTGLYYSDAHETMVYAMCLYILIDYSIPRTFFTYHPDMCARIAIEKHIKGHCRYIPSLVLHLHSCTKDTP